ncbi:MAG: hypothetical protein ACE5OZ_15915 [Candidatus Heimdallarchaeota archaeon]
MADVDPKFQEIQRTSLLICLFSNIDPASYQMDNRPYLLGGEGLVEDKQIRNTIEEAFGQLNLPDLFQQFDFYLTSSNYESYKLREDLRIAPYLYTAKAKFESTYVMILIITPWSDLNVWGLWQEMAEVIKDYTGVHRRTTALIKNADASLQETMLERRDDECIKAGYLLLTRIYYKLFLERSISGGIEKIRKPTNLFAVMFLDGRIRLAYLCKGECGAEIPKEKLVESSVCPFCQGEIEPVPPAFVPERISIAYPEDLLDLEKEEVQVHPPINCLYFYQASSLPDEMRLITHQIDADIFHNVVPLPNKAFFDYREGDDVLSLYSLWQHTKEGTGLRIVTGIGDSRVSSPGMISHMAMRIFVRDLNEGVKKGLNRDEIIQKSVLRDWAASPWIKLGGETTPDELISWTALHGKLTVPGVSSDE